MKPNILFLIFIATLLGGCAQPEPPKATPLPVIFDTDLGNDIDDVLALQMLLNYEKQGKVDLLAITLCKANPNTIPFVDGYCRFNECFDKPMAYAYHGVTPEDGSYLLPTLQATYEGKPLLLPVRTIDSNLPEGYKLMRRILAAQPDSSTVLIAVGPLTNVANLLKSKADEYSPLSGRELVAAKVKRVVTMAGLFGGEFDFPEYNVVCDLEAAHTVFEQTPVRLTTTGWEVGNRLQYPHESILKDFGDPESHPLTVAYVHYMAMPYDRQTWDLTAVLEAVEPDGGWFETAGLGRVHIAVDGRTSFEPQVNGLQDYLIISPDSAPKTLQVLVDRTAGKDNSQQ